MVLFRETRRQGPFPKELAVQDMNYVYHTGSTCRQKREFLGSFARLLQKQLFAQSCAYGMQARNGFIECCIEQYDKITLTEKNVVFQDCRKKARSSAVTIELQFGIPAGKAVFINSLFFCLQCCKWQTGNTDELNAIQRLNKPLGPEKFSNQYLMAQMQIEKILCAAASDYHLDEKHQEV